MTEDQDGRVTRTHSESAEGVRPRHRVVRTGDGSAVTVFLALAFVLAWLPFLASVGGAVGVGPILMPVAPAIACIVVRRWVTREGFADAGLRPRLGHWPIYLVALLWPVVAAVVTTLVALTLGLAPAGYTVLWGASHPSWSMLAVWTLSSVLVAPLVLGEELGWRGYLQLRLFPARPLAAALATGFIWGIWHYPLILSSGEPTSSIRLTLITLPMATMTLSVFLGWIRSVTGTVWATSVAHASNNSTNDNLQRLSFTGHQNGTLPDFAIVPCLIGEALTWGVIIGASAALRTRPSGAIERFSTLLGLTQRRGSTAPVRYGKAADH
jgi:membrane protease YdiL (CAAX protease family)